MYIEQHAWFGSIFQNLVTKLMVAIASYPSFSEADEKSYRRIQLLKAQIILQDTSLATPFSISQLVT